MTELAHLAETARILADIEWVLIGGSMVQLHCQLADVEYGRATSDVDLVIEADSPAQFHVVARRLLNSGFTAEPGGDRYPVLHRFTRGSWSVDVMGRDTSTPRPETWQDGHLVIRAPGSRSALGTDSSGEPKQRLVVDVGAGQSVVIPNVWSAIALKGRAYRTPSANRHRHLADAIALFACAHEHPRRALTNSEREAVNFLLSSPEVSSLEHWFDLGEDYWGWARDSMLSVRADVDLPAAIRDEGLGL